MLTEYVKVKMDRTTHKKLQRLAFQNGKSMSRLLRESVYALVGGEIEPDHREQPPLAPPRLEPWRTV